MSKPEFPQRAESVDLLEIYKWLDNYLQDWKDYPQKAKDNDEQNKCDLLTDIMARLYVEPYKKYIMYYENQAD